MLNSCQHVFLLFIKVSAKKKSRNHFFSGHKPLSLGLPSYLMLKTRCPLDPGPEPEQTFWICRIQAKGPALPFWLTSTEKSHKVTTLNVSCQNFVLTVSFFLGDLDPAFRLLFGRNQMCKMNTSHFGIQFKILGSASCGQDWVVICSNLKAR